MRDMRRWDRAGASLVEMLLVLALGGLITAAAVSAIAPTNELARAATESTQHEDGARSTVHLLATDLRRVPAGGVLVATSDSVVVAIPLAVGAACANDGSAVTIYFGLGGGVLDTAAVDGYAVRNADGTWTQTTHAGGSLFSTAVQGRTPCVSSGGGEAGNESDYYTFTADMPMLQPADAVFLWDRQTFRFGASLLDPTTRGFHHASTETNSVEVAYALHPLSRFQYRLTGSTTWAPAVDSNGVGSIDAIRVLAGAASGSETDMVRDIPLMNTQ